MLTTKQRNTLIAALLFYAVTLFAFFRLESWMFLVLFVIHSVLLLLFCFFSVADVPETDEDEIEDLSNRITSVKTEWRLDTERLKAEIADKEKALDTLQEQMTATNLQNAELSEKVKSLETALVNQPATAPEAPQDLSSVLPQYLAERSESTTVNIIDVARSVAREFSDDAAKAGLSINISSSDESLLVKADQNLLRILFRNIVDNSIKYMNRHGSLIITVSSIGDDIFVVCKDTGEGLSPDETEHIFELNYQGSNRISGNGLGLFQAKAIVDFYGGTIYAKSSTNNGMGIYIQLPTT